MTRIPASSSSTPAAPWLARSVSATWWYTAGSVLLFAVVTAFVWAVPTVLSPPVLSRPVTSIVFGAGALVWLAGGTVLLLTYRRRAMSEMTDAATAPSAAVLVGALVASGAGAVAMALAAASPLLAISTVAFALCMVPRMPGVRLRLTAAVTIVLIVVWIVEGTRDTAADEAGVALFHPFFSVLLPLATVLSLWWWDVVGELDRARGVESRLAAVQERLRLAGDLHDLQGHHLQVIALQLELADRMIARDPAAAAEQVRLARASVDDARRGTRELAGRFRGVPLPDELANAADLLRAAGLRVDLDVAPGAEAAPADVLGPVVRECTTNVLKHGGGRWARLALARTGTGWELRVSNDVGSGPPSGSGSGLAGMAERVGAAGGDLRHHVTGDAFELMASVPQAAEVPA